MQITAHLKEKIRSIAQEEVILKHRLQALDAASKEKQDDLQAAKAACERSLLESKRVMKDFSRITDPALVHFCQASSPVPSSVEFTLLCSNTPMPTSTKALLIGGCTNCTEGRWLRTTRWPCTALASAFRVPCIRGSAEPTYLYCADTCAEEGDVAKTYCFHRNDTGMRTIQPIATLSQDCSSQQSITIYLFVTESFIHW